MIPGLELLPPEMREKVFRNLNEQRKKNEELEKAQKQKEAKQKQINDMIRNVNPTSFKQMIQLSYLIQSLNEDKK
tara:strand:+ start:592 stop:816 length:225 start_codon:yes stop_codon:yes gene_type:complete